MFKKCKNKWLNQYPCDVFLHNSLMRLSENNIEAAYDEICYAIIKSGGELTSEEKCYRNIFKIMHNNECRDLEKVREYIKSSNIEEEVCEFMYELIDKLENRNKI